VSPREPLRGSSGVDPTRPACSLCQSHTPLPYLLQRNALMTADRKFPPTAIHSLSSSNTLRQHQSPRSPTAVCSPCLCAIVPEVSARSRRRVGQLRPLTLSFRLRWWSCYSVSLFFSLRQLRPFVRVVPGAKQSTWPLPNSSSIRNASAATMHP